MIKSVYVQSAKEGVTEADFRHLWREHAAIAIGIDDFFRKVRRYRQSDCLNDTARNLGMEHCFAGIGELYYRTDQARLAAATSDGMQSTLHQHGARFFGRAVPIRLTGMERIVRPHAAQCFKLMRFFRLRDLEPDTALDSWRAAAIALTGRDARVAGLSICDASINAVDFDMLEEISFTNQGDLGAFASDAQAWHDLADEHRSLALLTSQTTLYDDISGSDTNVSRT